MYAHDPELIRACLKGDQAAWNELVKRYSRLVYSIALNTGLTAADADDIFQNVFMIIYRRLETLRDDKLIVAWIIRITYHECQHLYKRNPHAKELDENIVDDNELPQEQVELWEKRFLVHQALDQMDPNCRNLLEMLFFEIPTPSYQTIASRLGIPEGSIGPNRARCFKKLETILAAMGFHFD